MATPESDDDKWELYVPQVGEGDAPVAWQFRREPMARVVDHYRYMNPKETVEAGDEYWHDSHQWRLFSDESVGLTSPIINPARRPVYAPLPTTLAEVPDGRVVIHRGVSGFMWRCNKMWWRLMVEGDISGDWTPSGEPFTVTEYVAELRPIK